MGEAIIDYLRNGRPQTDSKYIFVKHRPPFEQATSFYMIMKTVLENSGNLIAQLLANPQLCAMLKDALLKSET